MKYCLPLFAVLPLCACTWVEPSVQGSAVTLVEAVHVSHCQALGSVTSTTKDRVGIVNRSEEKVAQELVDLARNKAASLGGDSIVAQGPARDGSQSFRVYRCG
ncbi:DUF4156 domain-containing protein [Mangrovimicrobium sediminis]|uniref:DUF4156 domain-containing protein n=1 Tax=Mangrovimicrobium sediminis TaxID=2562682 RepID=A0A4Z0LX36_9GAMM|nr:DUF4156 domain-containing protein [Haliea sp. SAOS-164]TGD71716.1 DUF4156 domain-containing protein [Haliea sp. SAOS-164]